MPGAVIPEIIAHYADDAAFQWHLRRRTVRTANRSLEDLEQLDDQIDASLDGLRIAGDGAWEPCRELLERGGAGEYFVASTLAFELGNPASVQEILDQGATDPDLCPGIISALGWMAYHAAEPHIQRLFSSDNPSHRHVAIAASALHRHDPGKPLVDALLAPDPVLRARALRAAGELGRCDLVDSIRTQFKAEEPACRFWAAWSAAVVGDERAVDILKPFAMVPSPFQERALDAAVRRMDTRQALAWQRELARAPDTVRQAVQAAGILGDPESVPWLLEQMSVPALARIAGESFSTITGADLAALGLEKKRPEGFESSPSDDPDDDNVALDIDDDLPWPNPAQIKDWWAKNGHHLPPVTRYFMGKSITENHLMEILKTGRQRQRTAAALELSMRHPGMPLFEVRAPGFRQIKDLANPLSLTPRHPLPHAEEDWRTAMLRGAREEEAQRARA